MTVVLSWLRAAWRRGRAGHVVVAVLVVAVSGVVLTATAGARRTASAVPRFVDQTRTVGVNVSQVYPGMSGLPGVTAVHELVGEPLTRILPDGRTDPRFPAPVAGVDRDVLYRVLRVVLRAGRLPDPRRSDEALATVEAADRLRLHVGSRLTLRDFSGIVSSANPGMLGRVPATAGRPVQLTIVGVGAAYGDIAAASARAQGGTGAFGTIYLTPAYAAAHGGPAAALYRGALLELRRGASLAQLRRALDSLAARHPQPPGGAAYDLSSLSVEMAGVQRAIRPDVVALWLFAVLVGLAGALVVGQVMARRVWASAADFPALRALGATRRQLVLASVAPAIVQSLVGVGAGVVGAVCASPLMPVGPARVAEPTPGVSVDAVALGLGAVVLAVALCAQAVGAAWLATSPRRLESARPARSSPLADALARPRVAVPAATGIRFALEPGRGPAAVPLRSTLLGTILAVAALVVAVTFTAGLGRLHRDPARYGWTWSVAVDGGYVPIPAAPLGPALAHVRGVAGWAGGNYGSVVLAGRLVPAVGIDDLRGSVFPTVLAGRPPLAPDEIVAGSRTLDEAGGRVGHRLDVMVAGRRRSLLVTGRVVLPDFERGGFAATDLGVGVVTTSALVHAAGVPPGVTYDFVLVRFAPGADRRATPASVHRALLPVCGRTCVDVLDSQPSEVNAYGQVTWTPALLAAVLGAMAALVLGHALLSSVRRRRRDLAVLKTVGFTRRQLSAAVASQATVLTAAALAVGLPLGVAAGRWLWRLFADQLGVAADPLTPMLVVVLAVPVGIAVGNLVALAPAVMAGRVRPAALLRAE